MARQGEERDRGVLVQACLECGKEYTFVDGDPPDDLRCEKCGNQVFRSFYDNEDDEVVRDFEESTARDVKTDDPATDVTRGDLTDLKNL
jgi:predicted  nucleic acid-binding Zn-ribbon protein